MSMSQTSLVFLATVVFISITHRCQASLMPLCMPCTSPDCNDPPVNCDHGYTKDVCGRVVCTKAPGERCGGPSDIMGTCAEGLRCNCERCTGCAKGLKGYECFINDYLCNF